MHTITWVSLVWATLFLHRALLIRNDTQGAHTKSDNVLRIDTYGMGGDRERPLFLMIALIGLDYLLKGLFLLYRLAMMDHVISGDMQ